MELYIWKGRQSQDETRSSPTGGSPVKRQTHSLRHVASVRITPKVSLLLDFTSNIAHQRVSLRRDSFQLRPCGCQRDLEIFSRHRSIQTLSQGFFRSPTYFQGIADSPPFANLLRFMDMSTKSEKRTSQHVEKYPWGSDIFTVPALFDLKRTLQNQAP